MAKLNQIIAIEHGTKSKVHEFISELYRTVQKAELFNGFSKQYRKKDDDGEDLPAESKRVQWTYKDALRQLEKAQTELLEITARKDWTNCGAKATVTLDNKSFLTDVPVTYLMFLEKRVTDIQTFLKHLPILDESEDWKLDSKSGIYKTDVISTHRTKKVQKPIVLYGATDKHPAQTQLIVEDVIVGFWENIKTSGSIPKTMKATMLERTDKILKALKEARESANLADEVTAPKVGETIFGYIFKEEDQESL